MAKNKLRRKISRLTEQLKQERYKNMNINEILSSADFKGEEFKVEALETGFMVTFSYRQKPTADANKAISDYWDYKTKKYAFVAWADVVKFLGENQLPQPPK